MVYRCISDGVAAAMAHAKCEAIRTTSTRAAPATRQPGPTVDEDLGSHHPNASTGRDDVEIYE